MIEVIERRPDPEYYGICLGCRSKLKYNFSDVIEEKYLSGEKEHARRYIICPECGEKIRAMSY